MQNLTNDDIQAIAQVVAATMHTADEAKKDAALAKATHQVRWQRRVIFIGLSLAVSWAIGHFLHQEWIQEGWHIGVDGFVAMLIEKFSFGVGEAVHVAEEEVTKL